jgi:hypothetical protein
MGLFTGCANVACSACQRWDSEDSAVSAPVPDGVTLLTDDFRNVLTLTSGVCSDEPLADPGNGGASSSALSASRLACATASLSSPRMMKNGLGAVMPSFTVLRESSVTTTSISSPMRIRWPRLRATMNMNTQKARGVPHLRGQSLRRALAARCTRSKMCDALLASTESTARHAFRQAVS